MFKPIFFSAKIRNYNFLILWTRDENSTSCPIIVVKIKEEGEKRSYKRWQFRKQRNDSSVVVTRIMWYKISRFYIIFLFFRLYNRCGHLLENVVSYCWGFHNFQEHSLLIFEVEIIHNKTILAKNLWQKETSVKGLLNHLQVFFTEEKQNRFKIPYQINISPSVEMVQYFLYFYLSFLFFFQIFFYSWRNFFEIKPN